MALFALVDDAAPHPDPVKPWRVLHACETAFTVAVLAEAQADSGMQPKLLAREYWQDDLPQRLALLTAWNDVRDWRHALNEADALSSIQLVHAHSFASAMAGVRGTLPLVYDFSFTMEEVAEQHAASSPWLLRSFRVAEQFALSHASAVVTHSSAMSAIARERGASAKNVFTIPHPKDVGILAADLEWAERYGISIDSGMVVFLSHHAHGPEAALHALVSLVAQIPQAVLLIATEPIASHETMQLAAQLGVDRSIRMVPPAESLQAIGCADLVIVPPAEGHHINPTMLTAMAAAKPIIAADSPENRACSPDGRGCVWYRAGNALDLEHRLAFVARNDDFRRALGQAARDQVRVTHGPKAIARQYNEVYRHAFARRIDSVPHLPAPRLYSLGSQESM